jgi:hypothetical protein
MITLARLVPIALLSALAGGASAFVSAPRAHSSSPRDAAMLSPHTRASDSLTILITNNMPHPMNLALEAGKDLTPLGVVNAEATRTLTLRDLKGDSVTVRATFELYGHSFSKTFPSHSATQLAWEF